MTATAHTWERTIFAARNTARASTSRQRRQEIIKLHKAIAPGCIGNVFPISGAIYLQLSQGTQPPKKGAAQ